MLRERTRACEGDRQRLVRFCRMIRQRNDSSHDCRGPGESHRRACRMRSHAAVMQGVSRESPPHMPRQQRPPIRAKMKRAVLIQFAGLLATAALVAWLVHALPVVDYITRA